MIIKNLQMLKLLALGLILYSMPLEAMKEALSSSLGLKSNQLIYRGPQHLILDKRQGKQLTTKDFFSILPKDLWRVIMQYLSRDEAALRFLARYFSMDAKMAQDFADFILLETAGQGLEHNPQPVQEWQRKTAQAPFFKNDKQLQALIKNASDVRIQQFNDLVRQSLSNQEFSVGQITQGLGAEILTPATNQLMTRLLPILMSEEIVEEPVSAAFGILQHASKEEILEMLNWIEIMTCFSAAEQKGMAFQEKILNVQGPILACILAMRAHPVYEFVAPVLILALGIYAYIGVFSGKGYMTLPMVTFMALSLIRLYAEILNAFYKETYILIFKKPLLWFAKDVRKRALILGRGPVVGAKAWQLKAIQFAACIKLKAHIDRN